MLPKKLFRIHTSKGTISSLRSLHIRFGTLILFGSNRLFERLQATQLPYMLPNASSVRYDPCMHHPFTQNLHRPKCPTSQHKPPIPIRSGMFQDPTNLTNSPTHQPASPTNNPDNPPPSIAPGTAQVESPYPARPLGCGSCGCNRGTRLLSRGRYRCFFELLVSCLLVNALLEQRLKRYGTHPQSHNNSWIVVMKGNHCH